MPAQSESLGEEIERIVAEAMCAGSMVRTADHAQRLAAAHPGHSIVRIINELAAEACRWSWPLGRRLTLP